LLAVDRRIVAVSPHLKVDNGNWEIEFFDSAPTTRPATGALRTATPTPT
jgi:hypothetical protein